MEIVQIAPTWNQISIFGFKGCRCSECYYRFGCWTSSGVCCPLKVVRLIECMGNIEIEVNENLGRFDSSLLAKIGRDLIKEYEDR